MKAFLLVVSILILSVAESLDPDHHVRTLSACSSYTNCEDCNHDSDCNFLNNSGVNYDTVTLRNQAYRQETEYNYCHNAIESGYLYISDYNYDLSMYSYTNASVSDHPLGEWRIALRADSRVTIDIDRDEGYFEEIYIYAYSSNIPTYYYSKQFATCGDENILFELTDTTYVIIRVKMLDDRSDYNINLQQNFKVNPDYAIIIIVMGSFGLFVMSIMCFIFMIYLYRKLNQSNVRVGVTPRPEQIAKVKFILASLKNMRSGKLAGLRIRYHEDMCVICLDPFDEDSMVHTTNEGSHTFHSKCLERWFRNIYCHKDLTCPHGTVVITPDSEKPEILPEVLNENETQSREKLLQEPSNAQGLSKTNHISQFHENLSSSRELEWNVRDNFDTLNIYNNPENSVQRSDENSINNQSEEEE